MLIFLIAAIKKGSTRRKTATRGFPKGEEVSLTTRVFNCASLRRASFSASLFFPHFLFFCKILKIAPPQTPREARTPLIDWPHARGPNIDRWIRVTHLVAGAQRSALVLAGGATFSRIQVAFPAHVCHSGATLRCYRSISAARLFAEGGSPRWPRLLLLLFHLFFFCGRAVGLTHMFYSKTTIKSISKCLATMHWWFHQYTVVFCLKFCIFNCANTFYFTVSIR